MPCSLRTQLGGWGVAGYPVCPSPQISSTSTTMMTSTTSAKRRSLA
jgi:hypothetical protein